MKEQAFDWESPLAQIPDRTKPFYISLAVYAALCALLPVFLRSTQLSLFFVGLLCLATAGALFAFAQAQLAGMQRSGSAFLILLGTGYLAFSLPSLFLLGGLAKVGVPLFLTALLSLGLGVPLAVSRKYHIKKSATVLWMTAACVVILAVGALATLFRIYGTALFSELRRMGREIATYFREVMVLLADELAATAEPEAQADTRAAVLEIGDTVLNAVKAYGASACIVTVMAVGYLTCGLYQLVTRRFGALQDLPTYPYEITCSQVTAILFLVSWLVSMIGGTAGSFSLVAVIGGNAKLLLLPGMLCIGARKVYNAYKNRFVRPYPKGYLLLLIAALLFGFLPDLLGLFGAIEVLRQWKESRKSTSSPN